MNRKLLQLLADNRRAARAPRIDAKGREASLYLYDMIVSSDADAEWFGGVSAESLVQQVDALDVDVIHLRINSPGGDVFAGTAIGAALSRHKARVVAHVDGLAASAATAIAVAADELVMAAQAMFMIHNAWTIAIGDKNDFLETAALLEKVDGTLASAYAGKTGKKLEDLKAAMDAETWFTAQEAVDYGFADSIEKDKEDDEGAKATWNLSAFSKAPKAAEPKPEAPTGADLARRARVASLCKPAAA